MGIIVIMMATPVIAAAVGGVWLFHGLAPALVTLLLANVAVLAAIAGLGSFARARSPYAACGLRNPARGTREGDRSAEQVEPARSGAARGQTAKSRG